MYNVFCISPCVQTTLIDQMAKCARKKKTDIIQQLEQAALIKKMAGRFSIEKLKRLDRGNEQCESDRREQINNPLQSPATRNV